MTATHLVVQAAEIATQNLKRLAKLSGASEIVSVRPGGLLHQAFRFIGPAPSSRHEVELFCNEAGFDYAFVPAGRPLRHVGLLAMDMDSTLITIECIDEIADMMGIKSEVAAITARSMRGEIDFRQSLTERVGLLAGLSEAALEAVYLERLRLARGADILLQAMHEAGARTLLVSGGFTFFTERLQQRLGLTRTVANVLETADGRLTGRLVGPIIDAQAKADALARMQKELGLTTDQTVALGDGANDLLMLGAAGYGVACHAKPLVRAQAAYTLDHVGLDGVLALFDD